jgi:4-nitrophenyl phosphatase
MEPFENISAFIIDMDGVLWHGDKPIPGLVDFFQTLRTRQIRFILATNNASLTPEQYVTKLARMGVEIALDEILTSGMATAFYLKAHFNPALTRIFVVGEAGAKTPLLKQGFTLKDHYENGTVDIVVCGKDETLTWAKLADATLSIRAGAKFFGTNADVTLPTERGVTHGNGAILAALEAATGVTPTIIGKPEPIIYQQALTLLGVDLAHAVAIGDRLDTDILGAVRTGIRSILVLTGISSEADLKTTSYQPTWIMPDIVAITKALQKN